MGVDAAYKVLTGISADLKLAVQTSVTEQDARLRLIDRMLVEVLGWDREDVHTEPFSESGYADYLLRYQATPAIVFEAKRSGRILVNSIADGVQFYKVGGPSLKLSADGFYQAARYALDHGASLACLTTGNTWVAFQPFPGNGKSYKDTNSITFPDLDTIISEFALFYDLFSRESYSRKLFKVAFLRAEGMNNAMFETLDSPNREAETLMLTKSVLANDIDPIFREFFGVLSGKDDKQMMIECFVESRESKHADKALDKIVRNIQSVVSTLTPGTGEQLTSELTAAVETRHGENVVIIGNKGSGKSTFIDRFFRLVLSSKLRSSCLVITVDLLDASGQRDNLQPWLADKIIKTMEHRMFKKGVPSYNDLKGIYFKEFERWQVGQHETLYKSDITGFNVKFGEYLDDQINKDRQRYLLKLLENAVWSRKLLPCLVFDNADHHDPAFQEIVFQWSQFIRREVPYTFVVMPVTDRTIWRLSKAGPFQTYKSKLLYLPVPSTREVLEKRIEYLKQKSAPKKGLQSYFLEKGVKLSVENINAFAASVEQIFIKEDFVARRISWLANHDIRRSLVLSQFIATSPYLSIDDLVTAYLLHGARAALTISYDKFMHALVLGEYNHFQEEKNSFVLNVFTIAKDAPSSPLVGLSILRLLQDRYGEDVAQSHLATAEITDFLGAMGVNEAAIHFTLARLLDYRLIEPYDPSSDAVVSGERYAVTHSGRMHYEMALSDPVYMTQMAYGTAMRSTSTVDQIRSIRGYHGVIADGAASCRAFVNYCLGQDTIFVNLPRDGLFDGQRQFRKDLKGKWVDSPDKAREQSRSVLSQTSKSANAASPPLGYGERKLTVSKFDNNRGFGFCHGDKLQDIFLHMKVLKRCGFEEIHPGDVITADVGQGDKGRLAVTLVYSVATASEKKNEAKSVAMIEGTVKYYDQRKGFGFVQVPGFAKDAFIHASLVRSRGLDHLENGEKMKVAVGMDPLKKKLAVLDFQTIDR